MGMLLNVNSIKGLLDLIIKIINVGQGRESLGDVYHIEGYVPADWHEHHQLIAQFFWEPASNCADM